MIKIFGSKDSLFYADNNSSWANDLALELGYVLFLWIKVYGTDDFGFLLDMFSIGMSVLIILLAFWSGILCWPLWRHIHDFFDKKGVLRVKMSIIWYQHSTPLTTKLRSSGNVLNVYRKFHQINGFDHHILRGPK